MAHFQSDIGSISKGQVYTSLLLSYMKLSIAIESSCLLSCSVFPRDLTIERDNNVVQWWSAMVLGLHHSYEIENLEDELLSCFKKFVDHRWLQVKEKDHKGNVRAC